MWTHRRQRSLAAAAVLTALLIGSAVAASLAGGGASPPIFRPAENGEPLVIGHRGAAGYRPEHTFAGYELAARMGADYVEPDLVSTKDGALVARHENDISGTTDVASHPEFASRRKTKVIDGASITGWFTEDFTLAELKTLFAKERLPAVRQRNTIYDNRYRIPTFEEIIRLTLRLSRDLGRRIGLYPETKHPTYFRSIGLPLEPPLVRTLRRYGLDRRSAKVFVQSFETDNLRELDRRIDTKLVQLLGSKTSRPYDFEVAGDPRTYADLATPAGLGEVARYADGVGPSKDYIVPRDAAGASQPPTSFIADAHRAGLLVHPYTFRNENVFLPLELRSGAEPAAYGNALAEYRRFYALGVDGLFSDNADTAAEARSTR